MFFNGKIENEGIRIFNEAKRLNKDLPCLR